MSTIDGYKHQLVGYFGSIPVYRPLEDIDAGEFEFAAARGTLVLGGGNGEHPALTVKSPVCAVAIFLRDGCKGSQAGRTPALDRFYHPQAVLEFHNWAVADYHRFYEYCQSPVLPNPFDPDIHEYGFESWLACAFGEFIFFAMPHLAAPLMSELSEPYSDIYHSYFNNILLPPPNMPVYANGGSAWRVRLKDED